MRKYMNRISKIIIKEIMYLVKSKVMLFILLSIFLLLGTYGYLSVQSVKQSYSDYQYYLNLYKEQKKDIEKELQRDVHVRSFKSSQGFIEETDNPLRYSRDKVLKNLYSTSPQYFGQGILGILSMLVGPLFFGIVGSILLSNDYKYKTIKVRAIEYEWGEIIFAKQVVLVLFISFTTILMYFAFTLFGAITYQISISDIREIDLGLLSKITTKSTVYEKILTGILISSMYSLIVSLLTIIFKRPLYPIAILFCYNYIVPTLGKLDLKNIVLNVGNDVFDKYGGFIIAMPFPMPVYISVLILLVVSLICFMSSILIANKQSKYA